MNPAILDIIKSASTALAAFTAILSFVSKYRDSPEYKKKEGPPPKADYDLAIEATQSDPFLRSIFEDLKKIAIINKNTGIYLVPEEIKSFVDFLNKGRVSPNALCRAWPHRNFKRDSNGLITELTFALSKSDKALLILGNLYSVLLSLLSLLCLLFFLKEGDPTWALLSLVLFGCIIISVTTMTGSLNSAARIEVAMKK